MTKTAGQNIFE